MRASLLLFTLLTVCSRGADSLPADIALNEDAGRGGWVLMPAHLENGKELVLVLDTGTSDTVFDKSLEPNLRRFVNTAVVRGWNSNTTVALFEMPKVYLGTVPLRIDGPAATMDLKALSSHVGRTVGAVLGMNCLSHYCVQLDFTSGKLRFLDSSTANKSDWGQPLPMTGLNPADSRPSIAGNLAGAVAGRSVIDTGDYSAGWLRPIFHQRWTNQAVPLAAGEVHSPSAKFGGEIYPNVSLREANVPSDGIGLRFLSRHLVTFDFPNHLFYLRRTSVDSLPKVK